MGSGLVQECSSHRVCVVGMDQDGVAPDFEASGTCNPLQHRRIGAAKRHPDRSARHEAFDLGGNSIRHDDTLADEHDAVGVRVGLLEVMRREDDRAPQGGVGPDGFPELAPTLDVQSLGGLVEQQQLGIWDERHCKAQPLLLSARALTDHPVRNRGDPGSPEHLVHGPALRKQLRRVLDRLAHREVLQQAAGLHDG